MTCEHCQLQLLPYVYDVLDPQERVALAAHLSECADCAEALKLAQQQQGLLAEAVKDAGADIVFQAPAKAMPAQTAPTVRMQPPRRTLVLLNRWAAAAAVLFLLFSAGGVLGWTAWRQHAADCRIAEERLAAAKAELANSERGLAEKKGQTQKEIRAIHQQIDALYLDWKNAETNTKSVRAEQRPQIIVNGPQVLLPGANARYQVEMRQNKDLPGNLEQKAQKGQDTQKNQAGGPDDFSQIQARVININSQKVLYQQNLDFQRTNVTNLDLPNTLPIKPGDDLAIEFLTRTPDGKFVLLRDNLKLVFPEYVTHLATDRPLYAPMDTVRFRSLTLERFSLKPAQEKLHLRYRILGPRNKEIFRKEVASRLVAGPNNEPIQGPDGKELYGLGAGEFVLPADLPDGHYTLSVGEVNERFNEEKRAFLVRRPQTARFYKELQFHRSSYAAGDHVIVQARVLPKDEKEAGGPAGRSVHASVVIDGEDVLRGKKFFATDPDGRITFDFTMPVQLQRGVGRVTLEIGDANGQFGAAADVRETLVRDIPLVVRDLLVDCYPEGGDLIVGASNRVYFQVRTAANKPADMAGRIVDDQQREVTRVQTVSDTAEPGVNQGLGAFTFTPKAGARYKLIVDSPIGIERTVPLPIAKADGVALTIPRGVVDSEIEVVVTSVNRPRELLIGAYCRGRMLDHQSVRAAAGQPTPVTLRPVLGVGGVYRVTVFEKTKRKGEWLYHPIAERLVYRKRSEKLNVAVAGASARYQPGETVRLSLSATNERKQYVPAVALVAVVDSGVLKRANEAAARSMPTHFLLTTEVRSPEDLENADFLLGEHPKAAEALDLLLGCQGWRRFAEQDPLTFVRQQRGQAPVFLANSANPVAQFLEADRKDIEKLDRKFVPQAIELEKKLAATEQSEDGPADSLRRVQANLGVVNQSAAEVAAAEFRLSEMRRFMIQFGMGGALLTLLFLGFFLVSVGLRRLSDGEGNPRGWLACGLGLLVLLFLVSVIGTIAYMGENFRDRDRFARPAFLAPNVGKPAPDDPQGMGQRPLPPLADVEEPEFSPTAVAEAKQARGGAAAAQVAEPRDPIAEEPYVLETPPVLAAQRDARDDRRLRREGNYQALLLKRLGRRVQMPAVDDPCVVRVYAHRATRGPEAPRDDFAPTTYWHPALVLPDGKADIQFDLSDQVTRFDVVILSHSLDGRLGASRVELESKLPFDLDPRTPIEISSKDQLGVPLELSNTLSTSVAANWTTHAKGLQIAGDAERAAKLPANQRTRELVNVKPSISSGEAALRIVGSANGYRDAVERRIKVVPDGFPINGSVSGVIENGQVETAIELPNRWIPGTMKVEARFFPSPLAELQSAQDALAREPSGCFEQTASQNGANVLMLQHLAQTKQANPYLERQVRESLQTNYRNMAKFECADPGRAGAKGGYAWFDNGTPDDALTAYALLQLRDLAKLQTGPDEALSRNFNYLADRAGQAPQPVTNAYTLWALSTMPDARKLDGALAAVRADAKKQNDPYLLALAALSHLHTKKNAEAKDLLKTLTTHQQVVGRVAGAKTSITGSQGRDLDVETTALAAIAWLRDDRAGEFAANAQNAVRWLRQQRTGAGAFGGTQATVLALQALIAYDHSHPQILQPGEAILTLPQNANAGMNRFRPVDNRGDDRRAFSARSQDPIVLKVDRPAFKPGRNSVQLQVTGGNVMPYTLTWSCQTLEPHNHPDAPIRVTAKLDKTEAREGQTIRLIAAIENVSAKKQGMTVAVLGLPAGAAIPKDAAQLKALQTKGTIAAFEQRGRELILYWRDLAPRAKVNLSLELQCQLPGYFHGPASRAYPYYDAERTFWTAPLSLNVAAR